MAHINNEDQTTDEVIQEMRTIKDTLARSLNYDVHRIVEDAHKRQSSSSKKITEPSVYSQKA
jgi:hypothetical protein